MNMKLSALALAAVIGTSGASFAQAPAPAATGARPDLPMTVEDFKEMLAPFERWKQTLPPATGPIEVVREEPASLPEHTVYRPAKFPARRCRWSRSAMVGAAMHPLSSPPS